MNVGAAVPGGPPLPEIDPSLKQRGGEDTAPYRAGAITANNILYSI